ncbi:hypothetical protein U0035_13720 [Niabella yanshanensis]|uniref:Uncharacterized protein n=1 Tax=Niabella yanshanensis TaxID=577386 RepID=A0ABZ0W0N5_9BACT|nr:hypothetical protein [Niabella yanshanensis]WQD36726.1 hypothetical protein U0035_13720 [Niabella yanshanensis]
MKSQLLLLLMVVTFGITVKAQTLSEVLNNTETPIFYYGIDFTKARLMGDPNANPRDIVERQFAGINALIINEYKKYDVAKAFRRAELANDLSYTDKRNEKADPNQLLSTNSDDFNRLSEKDIQTLISSFNGGSKTGTGLVFVVEGMSKTKKALSLWVTLFDIKTRKVLMTKRMEGALGSGFSFRNYWATGFKKIIDQIEKSEYKKWKSN